MCRTLRQVPSMYLYDAVAQHAIYAACSEYGAMSHSAFKHVCHAQHGHTIKIFAHCRLLASRHGSGQRMARFAMSSLLHGWLSLACWFCLGFFFLVFVMDVLSSQRVTNGCI
jgi:hypothetical protein